MATRKNLENIIVNEKPSVEDVVIAPKKKKILRKIFTRKSILYLLLLILAIGFLYYYSQYRKLSSTPDAIAKDKTVEIIKKISQLAIVPDDPNAVLASVTDVSKLKNEKFFANAQNGDYIVLFPSAMKAILYRPSINKIVEIGPLSSGQQPQVSTSTTQSVTPAMFPSKATTTTIKSVTKRTK